MLLGPSRERRVAYILAARDTAAWIADRHNHDRRRGRELDLAVAMAEVYRSDPSFAPPPTAWMRLATAITILLGAK